MTACRWDRLVADLAALAGAEPEGVVCIAPRAYRAVCQIDDDGHSIGIRTEICIDHLWDARRLSCFVREIKLRTST